MRSLILIFLAALTGCFQAYNSEEDDVAKWTVPVTNNPHVVPSHGQGFPGMAPAGKGPY